MVKKLRFISIMLILVHVVVSCSPKETVSTENIIKGENIHEQMKDKTIEMTILGIAGWLPSELGVKMSPMFSKYAKEKYGYEATFAFEDAPFDALFQKAATSMASKSQEFNIIISDSQWLGAFAEPGWIISFNDLIDNSEELKSIEWYDPIVEAGYMVYPDGSSQYWGLPQEGDVLIMYVREDIISDPNTRNEFKNKYGMDLPQTYEDFYNVDWSMFNKMCEFFTRPDEGLYGVAIQYSKEYDYMTGSLYPFIWSSGGEIWDEKTGDVYGILNTPENAKALEDNKSLQKWAPPGVLNYGINEIVDIYTQGKVVFAFQWAAMGGAMDANKAKGKTIAVVPPGYKQDDGSIKRIYSLGGQPWVINAFNDPEHMQVSVDFLKWWYMPETQLEFAKLGGNPTTSSALESEGFEDIQFWFRAYKDMLTTATASDFWHEPKYAEMLTLQQTAFTSYASGIIKDPAQVLEYIAYQHQKILYEDGRTKTPPPENSTGKSLE